MLRKESYKDLSKYQKTKREQTKRYRNRHGAGKRAPWTHEELWMVLEHKIPDSQLEQILPHSIQAIQHARHRLRTGEIHLPGYNPDTDLQYGTLKKKG